MLKNADKPKIQQNDQGLYFCKCFEIFLKTNKNFWKNKLLSNNTGVRFTDTGQHTPGCQHKAWRIVFDIKEKL